MFEHCMQAGGGKGTRCNEGLYLPKMKTAYACFTHPYIPVCSSRFHPTSLRHATIMKWSWASAQLRMALPNLRSSDLQHSVAAAAFSAVLPSHHY